MLGYLDKLMDDPNRITMYKQFLGTLFPHSSNKIMVDLLLRTLTSNSYLRSGDWDQPKALHIFIL